MASSSTWLLTTKAKFGSFCLTPGNVDDRDKKVIDRLSKGVWGKLFGDRGYISGPLAQSLYEIGIELITKFKKNMKKLPTNLEDAILLRKRALIESINDFLKNECYIEHSRHRSVANFFGNISAAIAAYSFLPKKPSLKKDINYTIYV